MGLNSPGLSFSNSLNGDLVNLFKYRPDIDGLRAIAVLSVIIYHTNKSWLPGGFIGVDIFFVISGYVVTASLLRNQSHNITEYLTLFYTRRIKRILPALFFCILFNAFLTLVFVEPIQSEFYIQSALHSLIGISNIYFAYQQKSYFDSDQDLNPFLHTWSLAIEEQFYLIFPLILFVSYKSGALILKKLSRTYFILVGILILAVIVSIYIMLSSPLNGYYLMPSRFWELVTGATLFVVLTNGFRISEALKKRLIPIASVLAVGLLGLGLFMTQSDWGFPLPWALPAVLSSVLFITVGVGEKSFLSNLLANSQLVFIGRISYSLYLWHWPILTMFRWSVGLDGFVKKLIAILIIVTCSLFSYYCIEKPVRNLNLFNLQKILVSAGLALFSIGVTIFSFYKLFAGSLYFGFKVDPYNWIYISFTNDLKCGPFWFEDNIYAKITNYNSCSIRVPNTKNIYIIGDSIAESLIPMFQEITKEKILSATVLTFVACPTTPSLKFFRMDGFEHDSCFQYSQTEMKHAIESSRSGDVVFLGYHLLSYLENFKKYKSFQFANKKYERISFSEARYLLQQDLTNIAHSLNKKGASLIIFAPLYVFPQPTKVCTSWLSSLNQGCKVEKTSSLANREPVMKVLRDLDEKLPNFYVWDPINILCPSQQCSQFQNGEVLFKDEVHLSIYGSTMLKGNFIEFLSKNQLMVKVPELR